MFKHIILIFSVLVLCSCASNKPGTASSPENAGTEVMQSNASPDVGNPGDGNPELVSANSGQDEVKHGLSNPEGDMEVVEVEATKEKKCTLVKRTGTHIRSSYCRFTVDDDQIRENSRRFIDRIKASPQGVDPSQKG